MKTVEETAIIPVESAPSELEQYGRQARIANAVRNYVLAHTCRIGKNEHPEIEAWQAIAATAGYALAVTSCKRDGGLVESRGVVKRLADGVEVGEGWGYCDDVEKWSKGKDEYAKRGMSQTRAMSRAARGVFGQVIPLISEHLSATPAEEMTSAAEDLEQLKDHLNRPVKERTRVQVEEPHDVETGEVRDDEGVLLDQYLAAPNATAKGKVLMGVEPQLAERIRRRAKGGTRG